MRKWSTMGEILMLDKEYLFHLEGFRTPEGEWVYDHMRRLRDLRQFIVDACNEKEAREARDEELWPHPHRRRRPDEPA